jgi:serine/threonine protein phosphatase PrpC
MQAAIDKEDELLLQGFREGQNFFATSGSTASLALVDMKNGVLVVGNIGDSHILMAERDPENGQVKSIVRQKQHLTDPDFYNPCRSGEVTLI